MSAPRLPQNVAKTTGAAVKNAGRFAGRKSPKVKSLGIAPKRFNKAQTEIWDEFNADFPWLGRSDRRTVELATLLQFEIQTAPEIMIGVYAQMRMLLSAMGGTPVDRSKISAPDDDEKDPSDEFLN